jgi:hypothetical protein
MAKHSWKEFKSRLPDEDELQPNYEAWLQHQEEASESGELLMPFVPINITHAGWDAWRHDKGLPPTMRTIRDYANELFNIKAQAIIAAARERSAVGLVPANYMLVITEEIGQDRGNDVSRIGRVRERAGRQPLIRPLAENLRIFHEHALALGAAHAVANGVESVRWQKDRRYAWV